jgi:hypothetical protein
LRNIHVKQKGNLHQLMSTNSIDLNKQQSLDDSISDHRTIEVAVNPYNRIDVINTSDEFFALREEWNEINDNSIKGNVFVSWEWMYTWWETYQKQGNRNLYILKCTNIHNELLGIAPFQIINNPKKYFPCSRQLILLATGETDGSLVFGEYMDLVIKQGHETAVISAVSEFLFQQNNLWDGIKFQQQLMGSHLSQLFDIENATNQGSGIYTVPIGNKLIEKTTMEDGFRTYIELPETYKEYLMSLRKKMRNNITRTYSRLESEQSFNISSVTSESEVKAEIEGKDGAIQLLANLNRSHRGNLDKNSVFENPNFALFHKRLLKRLLPMNKISLRVLSIEDEPVAALYSYVDRDMVHAYQSGFETENGHHYSLLTTMLTQEISNSIENDQINRFNFMYSNDEDTYKRRYSGTTEKMYNISYDKQGLKFTLYRFIHKTIKSYVKKQLNIS